jgi:hypothetical protein
MRCFKRFKRFKHRLKIDAKERLVNLPPSTVPWIEGSIIRCKNRGQLESKLHVIGSAIRLAASCDACGKRWLTLLIDPYTCTPNETNWEGGGVAITAIRPITGTRIHSLCLFIGYSGLKVRNKGGGQEKGNPPTLSKFLLLSKKINQKRRKKAQFAKVTKLSSKWSQTACLRNFIAC